MPIKKKTKKAKKIFVTITDITSLFMSVIYIIYVILMLTLFPPTWLNWFMLGITLLYVVFFSVKLLYFNNTRFASRIKKYTKKVVKYIKYGMRFVNVVFVVTSIVTVSSDTTAVGWGNFIPTIGVIVFVFTLIFSVTLDIAIFFIKRKIRNMLADWNALDPSEKKDKIDYLIEKFLEGLDNISINGFEDYIQYGARATQIIGRKVQKASLVSTKGRRAKEEPEQLTHGESESDEHAEEPKEE